MDESMPLTERISVILKGNSDMEEREYGALYLMSMERLQLKL